MMWFVIGLLLGLSVQVEPSSALSTDVPELLPLWAIVFIIVVWIGLSVLVAMAWWRQWTAGEREARQAADRAYRQAVKQMTSEGWGGLT